MLTDRTPHAYVMLPSDFVLVQFVDGLVQWAHFLAEISALLLFIYATDTPVISSQK